MRYRSKAIAVLLAIALIIACSACSNGNPAITENGGGVTNNPSDTISNSNNDNTEESPKDPPQVMSPDSSSITETSADLKLPVSVQETVYENYSREVYIGLDGILYVNGDAIDDDVRSILSCVNGAIYHKNDGSLWGCGSGSGGVLGDGTGLDRDTPIKILDNVEWAFSTSEGYIALKKDKTVWKWGGGEYSPVLITEDVVFPNYAWKQYTLTPSGSVYATVDTNGYYGVYDETYIPDVPLRDYTFSKLYAFYIDKEKSLWMVRKDTHGVWGDLLKSPPMLK